MGIESVPGWNVYEKQQAARPANGTEVIALAYAARKLLQTLSLFHVWRL